MREADFQLQMGRLERQFGKFGTERATLLWREVKEFSELWLAKVIDGLIGDCRQTPLVSDFREEIARERERLYRIEKAQHAREAKDFFEGKYQPEDKRMICQGIRKRLLGQMSDQEFSSFMSMLNSGAA